MRKVQLVSCLVVACAGLVCAEDWPRFRGPTGQGLSTESGLPVHWRRDSNMVWKTAVPGLGWSSPIVQGNRVFLTTATEGGVSFRLLCLEREGGDVLWNKEVFTQKLTRKQDKNSHATPTPVTDGERVYVLSFNGWFAAFTFDGNVAWTNCQFNFYSEHGIAVSPILHEDLLIVPFDWSSDGPDKTLGWRKPWDKAVIIALDKRSGQVRWRGARGLSRIGHPTPVVWTEGGRPQLISNAGDAIQGFDLTTGERIWNVYSQGEGVVPSPVVGDGLVFTASGFEKPTIRAVRLGGTGDVTSSHIAWEQSKGVPMMSSFVYQRPWLFTVNDTGVAMCLKGDSGEIVWQERLGGNHSASPVCAEGRLYFLAEDGNATVIEAGPQFRVLARNPLEERCQASMAVSRRRLFIRTDKHLFCLGRL
jgi:outer membrane protein assembly factor BamB